MFGLFRKERELVVEAPEAPEIPWGAAVAIEERYRPLVERLERQAAANPAAYRRRIMFAAALGYGVVLTLLIFMLGLFLLFGYLMISQGRANLVSLKLFVVAGLVSWAIIGSLWVRIEPPEGVPIDRKQAPSLFDLVERLRAQIGGPHIHEILVTDDFNAAIVQLPRFGLFGGYRNYLIIGLPLLHGLTEEEAASVIAHELGHFAGNHGRFAMSIYRVRMTWAQLSLRLREGRSANLLRRFFAWYGPWFNAYSFALARADEYEADRASATATSPQAAASALIRSIAQDHRVGQRWLRIWEEAKVSPRPSQMPFSGMSAFLASEPDKSDVEQSLSTALSVSTGLEDTHPSLSDRLSALGVTPSPPPPIDRNAADRLLGPLALELASQFDRQWWEYASDTWEGTYKEWNELKAELAGLNAASGSRALTREERYRRAELTEILQNEEAALPLYQAAAAEDPNDHASVFQAARIRLNLGDAEAVADLTDLAARHRHYASAVFENLVDYHAAKGDLDAAEAAHARLAEAEAWDETVHTESSALKENDPIEKADFDQARLPRIKESLGAVGGLVAVHVAARTLETSGDRQHILFVDTEDAAQAGDTIDAVGAILFPEGGYLAFTPGSDTRWLQKKITAIEGARIYP